MADDALGLGFLCDFHGVGGEQVQKGVLLRIAFRKREQSLVEVGNTSFGEPRRPPAAEACKRDSESKRERNAETQEQQNSRYTQAFLRESVRVHRHHQNDGGCKSREGNDGKTPRKGSPAEARLQRSQIPVYLFE